MHLLSERTTGIIILLLWAMIVVAKAVGTGSLLKDRPRSGISLWLVHVFNFAFLLAAVPFAALLLLLGHAQALDPVPLFPGTSRLYAAIGIAGMLLYAAGSILMAWALLALGTNYQVGGNAPRALDALVITGPYRFVRHPMYASALSISLGLACLTHSLAYFCLFCVYVVLVVLLIPLEEERLGRAYGDQYAAYGKAVKRLIPPFF